MVRSVLRFVANTTRLLSRSIKRVRCLLQAARFRQVGRNFRFDPNSTFVCPETISIGDHVFMGEQAYVSVHAGLTIGNGVMFGPRPVIIGGDHAFSVPGVRMCDLEAPSNQPIRIEDDVWFGACVIILKGTQIGEGAVVGAGSLVVRDIPPYTIAVGVPCKPLRPRFSCLQDLEYHLSQVQSRYDVDQVRAQYAAYGFDYESE